MELRPHQVAAHDAIFSRLAQGVGTQLCALPTGTGKTYLAAAVSRSFPKTLFCVHREELARQTVELINRVYPDVAVGFVMPGKHDIDQPLTIAMIQTLHRRRDKIPSDHFDLVVVDEAHHALARTWREVCEHFQTRLRLGLSATPERLDGSDLSNLFSEISFEMTVADAIGQACLVPPIAYQCLTSCSLAGVKTVAGDLSERDLAVAVDCEERNRFITERYRHYADGRRAVAFAVNIAHAQHIAEAFNEVGIPADWVAGDSPDRADKLARFAKGEIKILSSCMVLSEGFDDTGIGAVLLCRPTKSRPLFAQMIGRGLRLHPDKQDCIVLDFVDASGKHRLASAWKFMGYKKQPTQDDEPLTVNGEKTKRESKVIAADIEREVNLLLQLPELPIEFGSCQWHYEPATERQSVLLARLGYDVANNDYSKGQAAAIISAQPPSVKQLRLLANLGYDTSLTWTRGQASKAFDDAKRTHDAMLTKIRKAGFKVEAQSRTLRIEPYESLTPIQRDWVNRHKSGLLMALRER